MKKKNSRTMAKDIGILSYIDIMKILKINRARSLDWIMTEVFCLKLAQTNFLSSDTTGQYIAMRTINHLRSTCCNRFNPYSISGKSYLKSNRSPNKVYPFMKYNRSNEIE